MQRYRWPMSAALWCLAAKSLLACPLADLELWAYSESDQTAMLRYPDGQWLPLSATTPVNGLSLHTLSAERVVIAVKPCAAQLWYQPNGQPPFRARLMASSPEAANPAQEKSHEGS